MKKQQTSIKSEKAKEGRRRPQMKTANERTESSLKAILRCRM